MELVGWNEEPKRRHLVLSLWYWDNRLRIDFGRHGLWMVEWWCRSNWLSLDSLFIGEVRLGESKQNMGTGQAPEFAPPLMAMKRLASIDAARGVAALWVLLVHSLETVRFYSGADPFGGILRLGMGPVRMPFFFVLSGFALFLAHNSDVGHPERLGRFLKTRFVRIYPTYWVVLALVVPVYLAHPFFVNAPPELTSVPIELIKSALLLPSNHDNVLLVGWTLQFLVVYYGLIALMIWRRRVGLLMGGAATIVALAKTFTSAVPEGLVPPLATPLFLCFVLGWIAADVALRRTMRRSKLWFTVGSMLLLAAATPVFPTAMPLPWRPEWQALANGAAAAVLLVGLASWEMQKPFRVPRVLLICGASSYSLYLIHAPLLSLLSKLGVAVGIGRWLNVEAIFVVFVITCVAAGILFHRWVEKPLTRWVKQRLDLNARGERGRNRQLLPNK
jgi:exopolysaccharide production protein ExoZ